MRRALAGLGPAQGAPPQAPIKRKQNSTALAGLARQHLNMPALSQASYMYLSTAPTLSSLTRGSWSGCAMQQRIWAADLCIGNGGSASNFFCRPTSSWKAAAAAFHFFIRRGMVFIWKKLRHWWQLSCGRGSSRGRRWRCGSSRALGDGAAVAARLPSPTPPSPASPLSK